MSLKKDNVNNNNYMNAEKDKDSPNYRLAALLDDMHRKNLEDYYNKENSDFINKIDKLNLQFYLETENYLNYKNDREKCQNKLFIILFKQINLYISEIERLNKFIKNNFGNFKNFYAQKKNNEKNLVNQNEALTSLNSKEDLEKHKKINDNNFADKSRKSQLLNKNNLDDSLLNNIKSVNINSLTLDELKIKYKNIEKKLAQKTNNEQKLNFEINNLKRQIKFYNEKLQLEIDNNKNLTNNNNLLRNTINPNLNYSFQKNFIFEKLNKPKFTEDDKNHEKDNRTALDLNNANAIDKNTFINNNINNYKNCDIININNNTYNTIITANNESCESSNAKINLENKIFGFPEEIKKAYFNSNNDSANILGQNSKVITAKDSEVINLKLNTKNLLTNNSNVSKIDKKEKTVFTSIISSSENLNLNQANINNINNNLNNIDQKQMNNNNFNNNDNMINLDQNSAIRNSSSIKNLVAAVKNGKISIANIKQKSQQTQQTTANSVLKLEKANHLPNNPKLSAKKRNYSDNNPKQQINQNEINFVHNNNNNNDHYNNNKNGNTKAINFNTRYSFIETKPLKNLSPKNILDVYNSNKVKNNSNKESLNSANFNTHINSNSNGNSISSNPFQKNPLSVSLSDAKHSTFNKNASLNPSFGSLSEHVNNGKINSGKDLKIVKGIKQSVSIDWKKARTTKSHSHTIQLHNFDFSSMKISNQQETKDLQDMIINNFNYLEEEFQEINELESQLIYLRDNLSVPDFSGTKLESMDLCRKTTIVSDIEDGYKSGNSFASDKNSNFSLNINSKSNPTPSAFNKNAISMPGINTKEKSGSGKFPILTSVTIDLNKI